MLYIAGMSITEPCFLNHLKGVILRAHGLAPDKFELLNSSDPSGPSVYIAK